MRQLGWVDGQNLVVERRFGESADQLRKGAAELVRLNVDVLFVSSAELAKVLQGETKTIPIVIGRSDHDLVTAGLVDSLAKPGGNITGSQLLNDELVPKRLELLKMLVPRFSKVAFLREDVTSSVLPQIFDRYDERMAIEGRSLGIEVHPFAVRRPEDLAPAFLGMRTNHDQGLVVASPAFMFVHRKTVIDLAAAIGSPRSTSSRCSSSRVASCPTVSIPPRCSDVPRSMWTGSSRAPGPPTCPSSSPPSSIWSSTSRPP